MDDVKGEKEQKKRTSVADFREVFDLFSEKVPGLVKGLVTSVFSEDAARGMAKAGAAYYQELKSGGLPEDVAVQMTKDYLGTFNRLGEMLRSGSRGFSARQQARREQDDD